jgi:Uma2 family endonuclease
MTFTKSKSKPVPHTDASSRNGAAHGDGLYLTPAHAGRDMSLEDFERADGEEGWRYELIDGRIEVSPTPELPHDSLVFWLNRRFIKYTEAHPEVVNYLSNCPRVYIPNRVAATCPQPDFAAFHDFPIHLPYRQRRWRDVSPLLVVEIISPDYRHKDLVRNVELYLQSPTIREYWIFDPLADADGWFMRVYRKRGRAWQKPIDVALGAAYTTRMLPEFYLTIDPDA